MKPGQRKQLALNLMRKQNVHDSEVCLLINGFKALNLGLFLKEFKVKTLTELLLLEKTNLLWFRFNDDDKTLEMSILLR